MGLYAEFDEENGSDSAQKILDDNPEIDVLQVAHNHVVVNEKQGSTVIGGVRNGGRDILRAKRRSFCGSASLRIYQL